MKSLLWKRTGLPAFHSGSRDRDPIDSPGRITDVAAYFFEALAPKQLTPAGNMVFAFKAVPGRVVAILDEGRSCHSQLGIFREFIHQKLQIFWIKGKVRIQVPDHFELA